MDIRASSPDYHALGCLFFLPEHITDVQHKVSSIGRVPGLHHIRSTH